MEDSMRSFLLGAFVLLAAGCAGGVAPGILLATAPPVTADISYIVRSVSDPERPEADRARDEARQPAEIMAFAGVEAGQRIADVGPGGGYYTRLFARAVGAQGRVFAIERPNPPDRERAILAVAPSYPNVTVVQQGYQGWTVDEPLDTIFISQIYHDFHLPLNLDVAQVNRDMFAALKPGGKLVIIDHAAVDGSDLSVTSALHRIDQATTRRELEAAGFVFDAESQVLRNPEDNRSERVFESDIRGHTDQFVMRFRKPA